MFGIVIEVVDSDNFVLLTNGYVTGLSGLTAGEVHFLSDTTAGALTTTEPTTATHVSKPLLLADSTTSGYFYNFRGNVIDGGTPQPAPTWMLVREIDPTDWDTATGSGSIDVWTPDAGDIVYDIAVAVGESFNDSNGDSATIGPFFITGFPFVPGYTFTVGHSSLFDSLGYVRLVAKTPYASLTPPDSPLQFYGFPAIFVSTPTDPITAAVAGAGYDTTDFTDPNLKVWALVQKGGAL